jgi:o-succinylbenzoate---CoA ligase
LPDFASPLAAAASQYPGEPAFVSEERTLTWHETAQYVSRISSLLGAQGIRRGERVALVGSNSIAYALTILATIDSGIVVCPINRRLPVEVQQHVVSRLGARLFDLSDLDWNELDSMAAEPVASHWTLDHPATIVSTSGSTAQPKAAVLSVGNHYYNAVGSHANIPFTVGDRWLLSLPLFHVGGLAILFRAMLHGGAVVIADQEMPIIEAIQQFTVSHVSLVSTQLYRLLESESELVRVSPRLSAVLLGGSGIPAVLIDRALEAGLPIHTSYGLTEMGSQVCATGIADPAARLFTSGRILPHRELRINPDGEILVRGDTRFLGYDVDGGLSEPFDSEGWFATGDIGELDGEGYLSVHGRKDNLFVSGGENILPEEIETALCRLPDVREVVVVAIEDDEFGFRPVAFVRVSDGMPFDDTRFIRFLERFLARFKIPDEFFPWPDDAPVETMKPDRKWFVRRANHLLNR